MIDTPATRSRLVRLAALTAVFALVLALGGCAPSGWAALVPLVLWAASLALAGCSASHEPGTPCCVETGADGIGRLSTCHCPAGAVCNYAPFADCGDGTCRIDFGAPVECGPLGDGGPGDAGGETDAGPRDAGAPALADAPGYWEPCCELGADGIGHVSTCFCPAGWACNYGLFTDCGGGTCGYGSCPDAGGPDAGVAEGGAGSGAS